MEASSAGDSGPWRPLAGAVRRGSSATPGQARKRAAHRRTPVARRVAGWRRQSGYPVPERRAPPPVRHSYRFSFGERSRCDPVVRSSDVATVLSQVDHHEAVLNRHEAPAARRHVLDTTPAANHSEAPAARRYVLDTTPANRHEAPASRLPPLRSGRRVQRESKILWQPAAKPPATSRVRLAPSGRSSARATAQQNESVPRLSDRYRIYTSPSPGRCRSPRPTPPARRRRSARRL